MPEPNPIYLVLRKDYDRHTDRKGRLALPIGVFQTLVAANAAARSHAEAQFSHLSWGDAPEHGEAAGGLYKGVCYTREDRRDHYEVFVKKMKIADAGVVAKASATTASKSKKRKSEGEPLAEGDKAEEGKENQVEGKGEDVGKETSGGRAKVRALGSDASPLRAM
ncbi:hypothetical protein F5Y17DRAFT_460322 [Xylariaceae sp. FL0594]|nr:hypothetical protein F5Y17DRAFT_460322 [Xylariaceae sp. FL0594]